MIRLQLVMALAILTMLSGGCTSAYLLQGDAGANLTTIKPGVSATTATQVLGAPKREWRNTSGVLFRLYVYDGGRDSQPGMALFSGVMAIGTLGITEVMFNKAIDNDKALGREWKYPARLIIAYGADDNALGIFEEFDYLPADGRNPAVRAR